MNLPPGPERVPAPRVCLVVLDGWGLAEPSPGNAVSLARTPVFDELWQTFPHATLAACGQAVGLPEGQMGNSEVGHLNLGAGAVVRQDLVRIDDAIWGIGAQFTPSPDLTLVVNYGHRNGTTAPSASLNYNITGRTTLSASYSEGISTITQDIANNLAISDINASGQIVDSRTGVPLSLLNPVLGLQSGVFLTKQLTATATTSWDRDRVTNYIYHQDNAVLAQSTPGSGVSQETTGTTLTWSHDLNPLTATNVSLGYARINLGSPTNINLGASTNANETLITAGVSVTYLLGPSLTSWASYSFLDRSSPQPLLRAAANVITVGVRKDF